MQRTRPISPRREALPLTAVLTAGLLAGACSDADAPEPPTVQARIALRPMQSCAELETYIEDTAVQQMRNDLDGWNRSWGGPALDAGAESPSSPAPPRQDAPTDYTETNTQVEGVDEADFVKTDGTRIFVLSGQKLYLARSWPPEDLSVVTSRTLSGYPLEMFLDDRGQVVVFSAWWPEQGPDELWCGPWGCGGRQAFTRVAVFDASGDGLRLVREMYFPGSYVSSRRIDGSVRLVLRDHLRMPGDLRYWPEDFRGDPPEDREAFEAALERVMEANEAKIRAQRLADWLPTAWMGSASDRTDLSRDCTSYHRPNAPVRLGLASVVTLDLRAERPRATQLAVLGQVGEIYASRDTLFLASPHWWWRPVADQRTHTYLHALDLSQPDRTRYLGSGGVPGVLLDQFSMDEHLGFLRVATTVETWGSDEDIWRVDTSNRVTVLGISDGRLIEVGRVTGLARGERITSARFVGDKGFVVTFEQIDPLFTLDLANPFAPRLVGELKVPGFSTYIHPLDDGHLLTIGVDLPDPGPNGQVDWSQRAMKLTVFDVTDFARPREMYTERVGTAYGWSEAGWNHKAFNWFPARNMLAIPFSDYRPSAQDYWGSFVSDLRLFEVDLAVGITPRGRVSMRDLFVVHGARDWSWRYSPWVRRSVMADDYAYAISDAGIRVVDMRDPSVPIATARFDVFRGQ